MNADYTQHRLLLISPGDDFKSCSLRAVLHENSDTAVELDCPFKVPNRLIQVKGFCDGLVCVAIKREVFLWNPSTGEFMMLPDVDLPYHYFASYGFAYDESIDDYKVVGLFLSSSSYEVQVYTLRSDSWRRIGDFPHFVPPKGFGTFVNRALHWSVTNEFNDNIVSLDLAKETFGEILEPEYGDGCLHKIFLEVLNGCLCIVRYCDPNACVDVWIMKEYGIKESWTKLFVIPYLSHQIDRLFMLKNGEVLLLHIQSQFVQYSPKDGTFSHLTVHNCSAFFSADPYVESLVSPHIN
ncbi:hypothetical protein Vadar_000866 [Vaccinium darrowii]|uniref:Uncharacterized protein n=1 Tax=Vaccinium darrowii TaxID=229202 RepID=A0ACB7ZGE8_9ERIC|nr:hypothetical protein Vadar_000866 [Vaccinium darrowii]